MNGEIEPQNPTSPRVPKASGSLDDIVRGFLDASTAKKRGVRRHQEKYRGYNKYSGQDAAQILSVLLAWEAGELTEGQASKALGTDRVSARHAKIQMIERGVLLACEWVVSNSANAASDLSPSANGATKTNPGVAADGD